MSGWLPDPGHAARIGRTELVRRWRVTREKPAQLVALLVTALFAVVFLAAAVGGAYFAGVAVGAGDVDQPLSAARTVAAGLWVFVAGITAFRIVAKSTSRGALDGLLTTVPARDVAAGLVLSEAGVGVALAALPVVGAAAAFALGSGAPAALVTAALALACVVVLALAVGVALGFGVQALVTRAPVLSRHRSALGAIVMVAYLGLIFTNSFDSVFAPLVAAARVSPVGWYADLALLPVSAGASAALAVAVLAATPVLVAAVVALTGWFAALAWYADPAPGGTDSRAESRRGTRTLAGAAGRLGLPRSTTQVAVKSWVRTRRAPIKVLYAVYPLFLLVGPVQTIVRTGTVPATLPALLAFYGAWVTGAAFALNPLGDEGAVLPVTLTTPVTGRAYVAGLLLAGVAVGAPLTIVLTLVTGVLSPLSASETVVTALGGVLVSGAAGAIAAAAGTAFPRFEATNVTRSRKAVVPSMWAFALYSFALAVLWLPSTLLQLPSVAALVAGPLGVAPAAVSVAGLVAAVALVAASGLVCFRYAARAFDTFTL